MFDIIISNFGFWFNIIIPVTFAAYLAFTHKDYVWEEFGMQTAASVAYAGIIYSLLFSTTADLMDREYWNGKVNQFNYYEEWTELVHYTEEICTGTGKNRSCRTVYKTRHDYHAPYWEIKTSNGETLSINKHQYAKAEKEFGSIKEKLSRSGQISVGDGNLFYVQPTKIIPTSVVHSYINYVTAAKQTVIKKTVSEDTINMLVKNKKLRPYPIGYDGPYGNNLLDRVIDTTGTANVKKLLNELDLISSKVGKSHQANPIIYITDLDRTFVAALEHYWNKAKKNDIVLVLGVDALGNIQWSDVIAWTNNSDFYIDINNSFKNMHVDNVTPLFSELIISGYKRKPMEEFSYLKENITLEWYWQFFIIIGNIIISFFITRAFLTNYNSKRFKR